MKKMVQDDRRLNIKDLINVGIFTAVYFIIFMVSTMTSYIPVMLFAFTVVAAVLAGIPIVLFLSRVKKFGMVTIMCVLLGMIVLVMGYGIPGLGIAAVCGVVSDLLLMAGKWKSWKGMLGAYIVMSLWPMGTLIPIFIMGNAYFEGFRESLGDVYVQSAIDIFNRISGGLILTIPASTMIAAVGGAYLGRAVLKKHFVRAGIV
ncbi:MAG: MptD family putative ECF transporter S component [Lachnospiraceae bacterium]